MAALSRNEAPGVINPLSLAIVVGAGLVLAVAIVAAGAKAVAALIGIFLFTIFLKSPITGLYITTILLLVSGITIPVAGGLVGMPQSAAKLCGFAAIGAWALNSLFMGKRFRAGWDTWAVLAFIAWALVGISMSLLWRMQLPEWTRLLSVVLYFILAIHVLDTPKKIHTFVMILVWCATIMAGYGILQYFVSSLQFAGTAGIEGIGSGADMAFVDPEGTASSAAVRITGGTGHSNWLAFTLLIVLPLNLYWYRTRISRGGKALVMAATLLELSALVLTFTRLGLLVGVIVIAVLIVKRLVRLTPHRVAAVVVALLLAWFALPDAYKERVLDLAKYSRSESTAARVELQHYAWSYMQDFPIVGIGLSGFGPRFHEENTDTAAMLRWMVDYLGWNPIYYGPHNFYLQVGSETGAIGLLIMLFFIVRAFLNAQRAEQLFKERGDANLAFLAGAMTLSVLSFIFCGLFLHALQQKIWWMLFAAVAALAWYATNAKPVAEEDVTSETVR